MELRGFRPSDLDALVALDDVCFDPPFRFSRSAMRSFVQARNARVTIAEATDGSLAGFCILHVHPQAMGYIVTLDVAPGARRRGLAGELMDRAEAEALEAGCSAVALHVFTGNATAIRFYERRGYVFSHRAAAFYARGVDALVYHKELPPISVGQPV